MLAHESDVDVPQAERSQRAWRARIADPVNWMAGIGVIVAVAYWRTMTGVLGGAGALMILLGYPLFLRKPGEGVPGVIVRLMGVVIGTAGAFLVIAAVIVAFVSLVGAPV